MSTTEVTTDLGLAASFHQDGERLVREIASGPRSWASFIDNPRPSGDELGDWWHAYLRGSRPTHLGGTHGTLRTLELFCGAGGLMLGFSQACAELGFEVRSEAAIDQDSGALAVYRANHEPGRTASESVSTTIDYLVRGSRATARFHYTPEIIRPEWEALVGNVDVVLAGPPCEGHSNLNNSTRRDDPRNELYLSVPAFAVAVGAPVVIVENVPGAVHDKRGVVETAAALLRNSGYQLAMGVIGASRLGWPQKRERFFLVARRYGMPLAIEDVQTALASPPRSLVWAISELDGGVTHDFMTDQPDLSDENRRRIDWLFDNNAYDLPNAERPECHRDGTTYTSVYGRLHPDRESQTITTGFMTPGRGRYVHPTERRVINALEAATLQGFPSTYEFHLPGETAPSKLQLGKWIGDAVPMPLGHAASLAALLPGLSA